MIATRTFIVRLSQADRRVVVENSFTRERVGLRGLSELAPQIERWIAQSDHGGDDAQGGHRARE